MEITIFNAKDHMARQLEIQRGEYYLAHEDMALGKLYILFRGIWGDAVDWLFACGIVKWRAEHEELGTAVLYHEDDSYMMNRDEEE